MNIGAGTSGLFFNFFTGWLFTNKDADAVMYVLFFCATIMCVLIVIMQIVASRHGERYSKEETDINIDKKEQMGSNLNTICDDESVATDPEKNEENEKFAFDYGTGTVWNTYL